MEPRNWTDRMRSTTDKRGLDSIDSRPNASSRDLLRTRSLPGKSSFFGRSRRSLAQASLQTRSFLAEVSLLSGTQVAKLM